ncbi:MAG: hypothetical protein IT195_11905 [Microthrixaceae bacterium]|nr:hypothetical protein [Microthrixaceae bacterium]
MTPEATAAAVAAPIGEYGTKFMLDSSFYEGLDKWGYGGFDFYFAGRGGVLGDGPADATIAAFGFMHPDLVRDMWDAGRAVAPVHETVTRFTDRCAEWGRRHFGESTGLPRLAALAERVVESADATAAPLFAGWRAVPRPADAAGATALLLNCLREHRGGMHLIAVRSVGLTALEAVLANGGEGVARFFGHQPPFPEAAPAEKTLEAEAITNQLAAQAYEILDEGERLEFVDLVSSVRTAIG